MQEEQLALAELVADLERIERSLSQFNLFEAIGVVRQEIRHSYLLSFLLDPNESHGLKDAFLQRFLRCLLAVAFGDGTESDLPDPAELVLRQALVHREWDFIDVLVEVEAHRLVVLIENKVDSGEHSEQLSRYLRLVRQRYPNWTIIPVLLSPGGVPPSLPEFVAVSFDVVCDVLDDVLSEVSAIQTEVRVVLEHYRQMLRRHILSDTDLAQLCREIYSKHKTALDLIFEHRPDAQANIRGLLRELVQATPGLLLIQSSKQYVTFVPHAWDDSALLRSGQGWSFGGNRLLAFQFETTDTALTLQLWLGPTPPEGETIRERLLETARSQQPPFSVAPRRFSKLFWSLYQKPILTAEDFGDADSGALELRLRTAWDEFVRDDLSAITASVERLDWLWGGKTPETGDPTGVA